MATRSKRAGRGNSTPPPSATDTRSGSLSCDECGKSGEGRYWLRMEEGTMVRRCHVCEEVRRRMAARNAKETWPWPTGF